MAATYLTEHEAGQVEFPELMRRAASGEQIVIVSGAGSVFIGPAPSPEMDPSIEATRLRLRRSALERGGPLVMDPDFADDIEEIIAMRRPGRGDPWAL